MEQSARPSQGTILVVDDEPDIVSLLEEYFSSQSFRVLTRARWRNGPQARRTRPRPHRTGRGHAPSWTATPCAGDCASTSLAPSCSSPRAWRTSTRSRASRPVRTTTCSNRSRSPCWGARVRAHLARESRHQAKAEVRFDGDLVIDYRARTVQVAGTPVELTRREFDIAAFLASMRARCSSANASTSAWEDGRTRATAGGDRAHPAHPQETGRRGPCARSHRDDLGHGIQVARLTNETRKGGRPAGGGGRERAGRIAAALRPSERALAQRVAQNVVHGVHAGVSGGGACAVLRDGLAVRRSAKPRDPRREGSFGAVRVRRRRRDAASGAQHKPRRSGRRAVRPGFLRWTRTAGPTPFGGKRPHLRRKLLSLRVPAYRHDRRRKCQRRHGRQQDRRRKRRRGGRRQRERRRRRSGQRGRLRNRHI